MRISANKLTASPTDLANFLACRHKTTLDHLVAQGALTKPSWVDPVAAVLRDRGEAHERRHVEALRTRGLVVEDLSDAAPDAGATRVLAAMRAGVDILVQAPVRVDGWFGIADVLVRVNEPSLVGSWSYEVHDTKLSRETRGGTILQLCAYSEMVGALQGAVPEYFRVVTPEAVETYRVDDFAAFYRLVKAEFLAFIAASPETYPEPTEHCDVCRWWAHCNARRRNDDHLSFVAGLGRVQKTELGTHGIRTLADLAAAPLPLTFVPTRGSAETYARLREQARLQLERRTTGKLVYELLPIEAEFGLCQLPAPSPGDLFLDLEGDPFAPRHAEDEPYAAGREYLFGLGRVAADGSFAYVARWAFTDEGERTAFEAVVSEIMAAIEADPGAHVYHYAPYEPAAFKRLMGRYASREGEIDTLLRGKRFVDLYAVVRRALRAGVENYSIKSMEPFYAFTREVPLDRAGDERRVVEVALETSDFGSLIPDVSAVVEGYNKDDCRSTLELRNWLEGLRADVIAGGTPVARPAPPSGAASEKVHERQARIEALRARLLRSPSGDPNAGAANRLLAYLLDWPYREDKVAWWEYHRLREMSDDDLVDEPAAVTGLTFVERIEIVQNKKTGRPTGSVIDRYRYPPQEMEVRQGDELKLRDETTFGSVVEADRQARTLDVKKGSSHTDRHPASAFKHERISPDVPAASLYRIGEYVADHGYDAPGPYRAGLDLLLRRPPRVGGSDFLSIRPHAHESITDVAIRTVGDLDDAVLPIQGPPGSGKTFTGAHMIAALVAKGKRVGVSATSHKVVRNLLDAVAKAAAEAGQAVKLGHKAGENSAADAGPSAIVEFSDNGAALGAISSRAIHVFGGTAWLWARQEFANAVDVLFIDEAGQMSLAHALAVSQAATSLVLLGDPQQLEQPQKGSHPDGVGVSALQHILGQHKTMPDAHGLFLPITWRFGPAICGFTSEVFYESKLSSKPGLERQGLAGTMRFDAGGLFVVEADHEGCRNASDAEVAIVASIVDELLTPGRFWIDEHGVEHPMTREDILVIAAYNAQVSRLRERLAPEGVAAGTVDRFQGQQAPVVIYSMATSRPEDAPRGLAFLYSLNRLNVATSRARCACILVASPHLFEPECKTPAEMRLANALCRYRELARVFSLK